ncbi:MAG: efflux RND transporter periplasmic adaptor subunit [Lachnospiraceae bacterium]
MKKRAIALFLAVTMGLSMTACSGQKETAEVHNVLVGGIVPLTGDVVVDTAYIGIVTPQEMVTVYPMISGKVTKVNCSVGAQVKAGDVLLEIDSSEADAQLSEAEKSYESIKKSAEQAKKEAQEKSYAQLESKIAALKVTKESTHQTLTELQNQINNATSTEVKSQLRAAKAQVQVTYDQAVSDLKNAEDELAKAKKNTTASTNETSIYDAQISEAEKEVTSAKSQLELYQIQAPIAGTVEAVLLSDGSMADTESKAFVISNKSNMEVTFSVAEAAAKVLKSGDQVEVEKDGGLYEATITQVGIMADEETNLFEVKASLGSVSDFSTGTSVKVYAHTRKATGVLKVPYDALYFKGGKAYVYCAEDGTASKREVQIGLMNDTEVEILEGLTSDDIVISTWSSQLKDGARVELSFVRETWADGIVEETEEEAGENEVTGNEVTDGILADPEIENPSDDQNTDNSKEDFQWELRNLH